MTTVCLLLCVAWIHPWIYHYTVFNVVYLVIKNNKISSLFAYTMYTSLSESIATVTATANPSYAKQ